MGDLGRLIVRFLVVPAGALVAVIAGIVVVMIGEWNAFLGALEATPDVHPDTVAAMFAIAPMIVVILTWSTILMLSPGVIGILIAEFFAIRSWIFHCANGMVSAWIGASLVEQPDGDGLMFTKPAIVIIAGLCAGLGYWLIAGWNAGFFRPVMRGPDQNDRETP